MKENESQEIKPEILSGEDKQFLESKKGEAVTEEDKVKINKLLDDILEKEMEYVEKLPNRSKIMYIISMNDFLEKSLYSIQAPEDFNPQVGDVRYVNLLLKGEKTLGFIHPVLILNVDKFQKTCFGVPATSKYTELAYYPNGERKKNSKNKYLIMKGEGVTNRDSVFLLDQAASFHFNDFVGEHKIGKIGTDHKKYKEIKKLVLRNSDFDSYVILDDLKNFIEKLMGKKF